MVALASACTDDEPLLGPSTTVDFAEVTVTTEAPEVPLTLPEAPESRQRAGSVRVGIWIEPDPAAAHIGGDIVRALIEPQLFTARPGGGWAPRLVEPASVVESADLTEVSFRLRPGAAWSDGSAIDSGDLRRTADRRFVDTISEAADGTVTVRFFQPLPGWRRLWSGIDSVTPPSDGLWGGPFRVREVVHGLETILVPNDAWWGVEAGEGPWLEELRLVVVPDQTTMLQLFEAGELDVVAPWPAPGLRTYVCDFAGCEFGVDGGLEGGGWQAMVFLDPEAVALEDRQRLLSGFAPDQFVGALLKGEAVALPFAGFEEVPVGGLSRVIPITVAEDVPMLGAAARAVQIQADDAGGVVPELVVAPSWLVAEFAAEGNFEALVAETYLGPSPCWRCLFGETLPGEAELADAGVVDSLLQRLATDALARPLWASDRVVAWHAAVEGVEANAWSMFATWNAWQWSHP